MGKKSYIKSQIVLAGTDAADGYVPADEELIHVVTVFGQPPSSSKADIRLVWDFGGGGEEILWSFQQDGIMPDEVFFTKTGDGVMKMALCLANGCTSDYAMSGFMIVQGDLVTP